MNNLFSFATKELSQDAFFCWAINWMSEPNDNNAFYELGKGLLNLFLGENCCEQFNNVRVLRQYKRIDVLIVYETNGSRNALIIEDKVNTFEHSNQIENYCKAIVADDNLNIYKNENIHVAYVKTGIHYDCDRRVKANIVTLEDLLNVLEPFVEITKSQILFDYVEYLKIELSKRTFVADLINHVDCTSLIESQDSDNGKTAFATCYGRFFFLDSVFKDRNIDKKIVLSHGETEKHIYIDNIYTGMNLNGSSWTEYCFWGEKYPHELIDSEGDETHYLFWKIDKNSKGKYYISLRHYDSNVNFKKITKANIRKENVYNQLHCVCAEIQVKYPEIINSVRNRGRCIESELILILVENLSKIGNGTFSDIQSFLIEITEKVYSAAKNLKY